MDLFVERIAMENDSFLVTFSAFASKVASIDY